MKENPFKSERQRRFLWATRPDIARRWSKMKKNPESDGFVRFAGGSYSDAYRKENLVESIVTSNIHGSVDLSKDIIVDARKIVSDNAKRFLPDISRKRTDSREFGKYALKEFIYEMPYYDEYIGELPLSDKRLYGKSSPINLQLEAISECYSGIDLEGITEAILCLIKLTESEGLIYVNDFSKRNLALKGSQLILLDIFYTIGGTSALVSKRWKNSKICGFNPLKQLLKYLTRRR
jgi:hypothetical protein